MSFDASFRQRWTREPSGWRFEIPIGWTQGRTIFGGIMTASAVALAMRNAGPEWVVRTVNVQFLRPTHAGDLDGSFVVHRQGKGTTFAESRLSHTIVGRLFSPVGDLVAWTEQLAVVYA